MRKSGILQPRLLHTMASMGHTDTLVVADSGLPIPTDVERIDLALTPGIPSFMQTLSAIFNELQVESAICAEEIKEMNPVILDEIARLMGSIPLSFISHGDFKKETVKARSVVRTGECSPYANIILVAGVIF